MKYRILASALMIGPWLCLSAVAQDPAPSNIPPPDAVQTKTAFDYYMAGGAMMHPILLCSIGTIAVLGYAFIQISPKKMMPKGMHSSLLRLIQNRQVTEAYQMCVDNPGTYCNVVSSALLKVNFDRDLANKASMEQAMIDTIEEEETRQMAWVNYLNVFATIAPMLGLLGTVGGMILSFDQLAAGKSDPGDLAGGIGVAMITTAGGLLVGIPAMFFYFFFRNRLQGTLASVQKNATFLIDVLSGEVRLTAENRPSDGTPNG